MSPEETLAAVRPHLKTAGITRLANITGLDRIGIHTVSAHRPNAPTLSNAAGKGYSLAAATVSAAMEGIELYHGENLRLEYVQCSYNELPVAKRMSLSELPLSKYSLFDVTEDELWVPGWDIANQRELMAPYACVSMVGHASERPRIRLPFQVGSNGLASGNHFLEAVFAGLCEVIERHNVTCAKVAMQLGYQAPLVHPATISNLEVRDLLERLEFARVDVVILDCTIDIDVPTYVAYIRDRDVSRYGVYGGYGTHVCPFIALTRAITEAVQSRACIIAGARDDVFRTDRAVGLARSEGHVFSNMQQSSGKTIRAIPSPGNETLEEDIHVLLDRLRNAGFASAVVYDISHTEIGIPVARVIVPGLEGYMLDTYAPGPRAAAVVARLRDRGHL